MELKYCKKRPLTALNFNDADDDPTLNTGLLGRFVKSMRS